MANVSSALRQCLREELVELRHEVLVETRQLLNEAFQRHEANMRTLLPSSNGAKLDCIPSWQLPSQARPAEGRSEDVAANNSPAVVTLAFAERPTCGEAEDKSPTKTEPEDQQEGQQTDEEIDALIKENCGAFHFNVKDHSNDHMENLHEQVYRVENFYKEDGLSQHIARSDMFGYMSLAVISMNAVYLGVDADRNDADILVDAGWYFQTAEHLFCFFFTGEIAIRFAAFKNKRDCIRDGWFKFDSALVLLMVLETWVMSILAWLGIRLNGLPTAPLRLLRLLRLSRLVRLMRTMPELVTMVKGMRVASRAVLSSLLMVGLLIYIFGIVLLMSTSGYRGDETIDGMFGELLLCMWTLLLDGTFMDNTGDVLITLRDLQSFDGYLSIIVFWIFMLLSAITVMNMLIGVLCEVVSAVGKHERDEADIRLVKKSILKELLQFDSNGDGMICQDELDQVMQSKTAVAVLTSLEVDTASLGEIHEMLFDSRTNPTNKVSISSIMESFLAYRGSLPTTVKHFIDGQSFMRHSLEAVINLRFEDLRQQMRFCTETLLSAVAELNSITSPTGSSPLTPANPPSAVPRLPLQKSSPTGSLARPSDEGTVEPPAQASPVPRLMEPDPIPEVDEENSLIDPMGFLSARGTRFAF